MRVGRSQFTLDERLERPVVTDSTLDAEECLAQAAEAILVGEYQKDIDSCTEAIPIEDDYAEAFAMHGDARCRIKPPTSVR